MFFCKNRGLKAGSMFLTHHQRKGLISEPTKALTSGIIVTGDEVLKGKVLDTNSYFLCRKLYDLGIKVVKISKIEDDVNKISSIVKKFSSEFDYVLTTGGVGPTHDDVTYEAVGKAFNDELFYHPELSKFVFDFYKTTDPNHPALKMACIPKSSKLTYGFDPVTQKRTVFPNISVKNVYMFPGVPYLCERIFNFTYKELFKSTAKFHMKNLYFTQNEDKLVKSLNETVEKYPDVVFGSYPKYFHSYYNVKISMESTDETQVVEACQYLEKNIPKDFQTNYDDSPFVNKMYKVNQFKDPFFVETLYNLRQFLKKKNPDNIFLYFDGGKNSTVLLHILSVLYEEFFPNSSINGFYVEKNPKINQFIEAASKNYNINVLKLSEKNFSCFVKSNIDIIVIKGTRSSDPKAADIFKYFDSFSVYNPLLKWTYSDVWYIIRGLFLPYCKLYDEGYTSICEKDSTPNSNLITDGPRKDLIYYKKAFELGNDSLENS